ncbi:MAG TPA: zinc ribbon domain-containing protein [Candidatus Acidoferrales bacterium]|nr:zinc ribbon domain-containing protein [Candidatus Acidoferrales bacterium]
MFCVQCGRELASDAHFCGNCRRPLAGPPVPQRVVGDPQYAPQAFYGNRVQNHARVLGILWIIYGCFRALAMGWIWFIGRAVIPSVLGQIGPSFSVGTPLSRLIEGGILFASVLLVLQAALAFFAGWGLLERQSWGRIVAIIAGVFSLWQIPFGTALGIYTLWVLLPASSEAEYHTLARV